MTGLAALVLLASAAGAAPLSLEQEVGQLFMIAIDTEIAARYEPDIRAGRLGSAMLRWDKFTGDQARALSGMLDGWTPAALPPFLLASDHEGGTYFTQRLYGGTVFPGNMALGAAGDAGLAREAARVTARELRAIGVRFDFAPVLDVASDPANPIVGVRSFGEDPALVSRLGAAAVRGFADGGVLASAKHFPGHGDTREDSHVGLPASARSDAELEAVELAPFRAAIAAGVPAVMPAHMVFPGLGEPTLPVTLSSAVIEGVLRRRLAFQGLVVSDSMDMGAIADRWGTPEAAVRAFEAGCDLLLVGKGDYLGARAALEEAVRSGRVPRARLERSVDKILALKRRFSGPGLPLSQLRRPAHAALARRIAERSVTLLRAERGVLPLRRDGRVVVVAARPPAFAGELRGFFEAVRARAPQAELVEVDSRLKAADAETAAAKAAGADAVIFVSWSWGSSKGAQAELGRRLGPSTIHVAAANPYGLGDFPDARSALATYGAAPASLEAAARLLFGELKPKGRLPVTIPGFAARGDGLGRLPRR